MVKKAYLDIWEKFKALLDRFGVVEHEHTLAAARRLALGAAFGMWVNFLPLPGLGHFVAMGLAWVCRANIAASVVGQLPGNLWTSPLIWWASLKVGWKFWGGSAGDVGSMSELMKHFEWGYMLENLQQLAHTVLVPLVLGGQILGIPLAALTYVLVYYGVLAYWDSQKVMQHG